MIVASFVHFVAMYILTVSLLRVLAVKLRGTALGPAIAFVA